MTYTNTDTIDQALKAFKRLSIEEQLGALAAIYKEAASSISSGASNASSSKEVADLFDKFKGLREGNQMQFLQDALTEKKTSNEEVALDPHPSKAMLELIPGAAEPPISQYNDLGANDRLAFWYQVAQHNGNGILAIPADFQPSEKVTELLSSLKAADLNQQIQFLSQIV